MDKQTIKYKRCHSKKAASTHDNCNLVSDVIFYKIEFLFNLKSLNWKAHFHSYNLNKIQTIYTPHRKKDKHDLELICLSFFQYLCFSMYWFFVTLIYLVSMFSFKTWTFCHFIHQIILICCQWNWGRCKG